MSVFPEKSAMWKQKCLAVGSEERLREERRGRELSKFNLGERSTQSQIQKTLTKDMSFYCPLEALIKFSVSLKALQSWEVKLAVTNTIYPTTRKKNKVFFKQIHLIELCVQKQTDKTEYL